MKLSLFLSKQNTIFSREFVAEDRALSLISDLVSGGTLSRENEIDDSRMSKLHQGRDEVRPARDEVRQALLSRGFQGDPFMNLQILNLSHVSP